MDAPDKPGQGGFLQHDCGYSGGTMPNRASFETTASRPPLKVSPALAVGIEARFQETADLVEITDDFQAEKSGIRAQMGPNMSASNACSCF